MIQLFLIFTLKILLSVLVHFSSNLSLKQRYCIFVFSHFSQCTWSYSTLKLLIDVFQFLKESDNEKGGQQSLGEESDHEIHSKGSTSKKQHSRQVSPPRKRAQSSDEEEEEKTEEEKQQELVSNV